MGGGWVADSGGFLALSEDCADNQRSIRLLKIPDTSASITHRQGVRQMTKVLRYLVVGSVVVAASASTAYSTPASIVANRSTAAILTTIDIGVPVAALNQVGNCVYCVWHQWCGAEEHTGDLLSDSTVAGFAAPHEDCLRNPTSGGWCSGHPLCGGIAARDDSTVKFLAAKALDGSESALAELVSRFRQHVRLNSEWGVVEILRCPGANIGYGTLPAEQYPATMALLDE
jgi:hypothetical protein